MSESLIIKHQNRTHTDYEAVPEGDAVNHPKHYNSYFGIEVIDLTEQMNFNRGNIVKYVARAGLKEGSDEVVDLEKALWYLNREIQRVRNRVVESV